ncbi:hypothetical protein CTI12_AA299060 [Artemisia annua]|uniref:RRM domain-containing protein n=1 Tax=Artemisia annua TaxID=35608 RepID=A0A2U1N2W1_ARTAN|nr:hypothetical protein CTI12_AA299060 [Artemisia annua]
MGDFFPQESKEREDGDNNGWTWVIGKRNRHLRSNLQPNQQRNKETHTTHAENSTNTTTFYFTNFPSNWDHSVMKDIFAKYGLVEDVYIGRKRNTQGKRFGFARFLNVQNISTFEQKLNTICIGTQKIRCNVARHQRRPSGFCRNNTYHTPTVAPHTYSAKESNGGSYAAALTGIKRQPHKPQSNPHIIIIQPEIYSSPPKDTTKSVIAELKTVKGASNTHNLILDEGFDDFLVKYLGGLHLLINLPDKESTTKLLANTSLLNHFKSLKPWTNNLRITERVTWLTISSLPPKLWTTEAFHTIASSWGEVIIPEDCNPRQFNRTTGRVCILTPHLEIIRSTSYVPVDNVLIPIRIRESDGDIDSLFNGYYHDSSSDDEDANSVNDMDKDNMEGGNDEDADVDSTDDSENEESVKNTIPSTGISKKTNSGDEIFLDKRAVFRKSAMETGDNFKDMSTSNLECGVKDKQENMPPDMPVADSVCKRDVKSTCGTRVSITTPMSSNLNSPGQFMTSKAQHISLKSPSCEPINLPSFRAQTTTKHARSPRQSPCQEPTVNSRRSSSVPALNSFTNHIKIKRYSSLKLIDPILGIRRVATQPRKNQKNKNKKTTNLSQPVPSNSFNHDETVEISDSFSKISRCNTRNFSKPSVSMDSPSNKVENTILLGKKIGFDIDGKDQEIASIIANGDHMVDQ